MSKSKRLIELLITVNTNRKFTTKQLADEFGVSKRTILRDLQELAEAGIPLYAEVGASGGYRTLKEKMLPPISFSETQAVAMFFANQSLNYYSSLPFQSESVSALKKFYHYLPDQTRQRINDLQKRITFWTPERVVTAPHLDKLLEHALEQTIITITYDSEQEISQREIQVIGLYAMNGLWYCPAYCFQKEEIRLFRVDRILSLAVYENQSKRRNYSNYTIQNYLEATDAKALLPLVVKLTRSGVKRCESDSWLAKGLSILPDETGMIEMKIEAGFIPWAANFFLGCGSNALVESPVQLIVKIKENIRILSNHYF